MTTIGRSIHYTGLRALRTGQQEMAKALERLMTGKRINRASDDPAGLQAAEKLHARRVTLTEIVEAAERANALIDTADGALGELAEMVLRLQGLVTENANRDGLTSPVRQANQEEADAILQGIARIAATTTFNGDLLFDGTQGIDIAGRRIVIPSVSLESLGNVSRPVEEDEDDGDDGGGGDDGDGGGPPVLEHLSLADLASGRALNLLDGDIALAQEAVKVAVSGISGHRAYLGQYRQFTLGHEVGALEVELENTVAAESQIMDADLAEEVANLARAEIATMAATNVLALAQQATESLMTLLDPLAGGLAPTAPGLTAR